MSILDTSKNFRFMYLTPLALLSHSQGNPASTQTCGNEERARDQFEFVLKGTSFSSSITVQFCRGFSPGGN